MWDRRRALIDDLHDAFPDRDRQRPRHHRGITRRLLGAPVRVEPALAESRKRLLGRMVDVWERVALCGPLFGAYKRTL